MFYDLQQSWIEKLIKLQKKKELFLGNLRTNPK
jgi:hypothetical protein